MTTLAAPLGVLPFTSFSVFTIYLYKTKLYIMYFELNLLPLEDPLGERTRLVALTGAALHPFLFFHYMEINMSDTSTVTHHLVPEDQRLDITANLFGSHFPLRLEPVIYGITERMAQDYHGGYWLFYSLDNGGFYMAPDGELVYPVSCDNCYQGELGADALGVVASLFAYSHLSFSGDTDFARACARHYHLLREYMMEHAEVAAILGAID
jgi:hypothetical protein